MATDRLPNTSDLYRSSTQWYCTIKCDSCAVSCEITSNLEPETEWFINCPFCRAELGIIKSIGRFDR